MRKTFVLLLVGMLVCGALASSALAAKPVLEVWMLKQFVLRANEEVERQMKEWGEKNNMEVKVQWLTFADITSKYVAGIETGTTPCIGELDSTGAPRYIAMGQLTDVSDLFKEISETNGGALEYSKKPIYVNGKYWTIPNSGSGGVWYVRDDLRQKTGLPLPQTWDEVVKLAQAINKVDPNVYGIGTTFNRSSDGEDMTYNLIWSFGGQESDEAGEQVMINSPETLAALKWAMNTYTTWKIQPPGAMGWTDSSNNEAWMAGKIGQTTNGPSIYYALAKKNHELLDATRLTKGIPAGPAGRARLLGKMMSFGIFKTCKYKEEAKSLLRYIMVPHRRAPYLYYGVGQITPIYQKEIEDMFWNLGPNLQAARDCYKHGRYIGWPGVPNLRAAEVIARHVYTDMIGRAVSGKLTPEQALAEAEARVKDIYKTMPKFGIQ